MLKAIKAIIKKVMSPDNSGVHWLLNTPYANY